MITTDYCSLMARYNQWMNKRLYEVCSSIGYSKRKENLGAFFDSIHSTLNHILYGDLAFLARFTNDPPEPPEIGVDLYADFSELQQQRIAVDIRILQWSTAFTQEWLQTPLTYTSKVDGVTRTVENWVLIVHLFNHQTHHRGQVTTLLSQLDLDMGTTDIPFMPGIVQSVSDR